MGILSGIFRCKDYLKTDDGYQLISRFTKSNSVVMGDGSDENDTLERRFGGIKGSTGDLTKNTSDMVLTAYAGNQLYNNKQDKITGAATTILSSNLASDRIMATNSEGKASIFNMSTSYLNSIANWTESKGAFQTQINNLANDTQTQINTLNSNIFSYINKISSTTTINSLFATLPAPCIRLFTTDSLTDTDKPLFATGIIVKIDKNRAVALCIDKDGKLYTNALNSYSSDGSPKVTGWNEITTS